MVSRGYFWGVFWEKCLIYGIFLNYCLINGIVIFNNSEDLKLYIVFYLNNDVYY